MACNDFSKEEEPCLEELVKGVVLLVAELVVAGVEDGGDLVLLGVGDGEEALPQGYPIKTKQVGNI